MNKCPVKCLNKHTNIYRHVKDFTFTEMLRNACIGCGHFCTEEKIQFIKVFGGHK